MKTSNVLVLISVLLYIDASTEWPTHTVCKEDNLEIHYKSCATFKKAIVWEGKGKKAMAVKCPEQIPVLFEYQSPTSKCKVQCSERLQNITLQRVYQHLLPDHSNYAGTKSSGFPLQPYPQQDFAFSIDRCSDITTHTFNIRAAMVLRHSIKELYVKVDLIINGKTVLTYSETLCGPGHSKLIFCGKKKGEHLYYEGPVTLGIKEIPQGDYTISAKLTNEDGVTVTCADFTVKNYLDYY